MRWVRLFFTLFLFLNPTGVVGRFARGLLVTKSFLPLGPLVEVAELKRDRLSDLSERTSISLSVYLTGSRKASFGVGEDGDIVEVSFNDMALLKEL